MLKSILVGLDGSLCSQAAMDLGIDWARKYHAALVGIGVVDEPTILKPEIAPIGASYYKEHSDKVQLENVNKRIDSYLEHFTNRCSAAGVSPKPRKEIGDPAEQIILQSQRYDLTLLGQQTFFQFLHTEGPCDTLKKVLKGSCRPVVVVPEVPNGGDCVVILFDGSLQAARATQAFEALGLCHSKPVHIVAVDSVDELATGNVERAAEFLSYHGISATPHVIPGPDGIAASLLGKAKELDASLLVMGAYGRSMFHDFFLGSVTKQLLSECKIPMFVTH